MLNVLTKMLMFRCKCSCRPLGSDSQENPIRLAIKHLAPFPLVSPVWFPVWTDLLYVLNHTNLLQYDWLKCIRTSTIFSYRVWSLAGRFLGTALLSYQFQCCVETDCSVVIYLDNTWKAFWVIPQFTQPCGWIASGFQCLTVGQRHTRATSFSCKNQPGRCQNKDKRAFSAFSYHVPLLHG